MITPFVLLSLQWILYIHVNLNFYLDHNLIIFIIYPIHVSELVFLLVTIILFL